MSNYLLIDTREKPKAIQSIVAEFDRRGIQYERTKLLFGDYMEWHNPSIVVDRKQNIAELAKNCTIEAERFKEEMVRAQRANSELVILVEQNRYIDRNNWVSVKDIADLMTWSSPHTTIRGEKVFRVLSSWIAKYPIRVEFCDKRQTGRRILEILYGGEQ